MRALHTHYLGNVKFPLPPDTVTDLFVSTSPKMLRTRPGLVGQDSLQWAVAVSAAVSARHCSGCCMLKRPDNMIHIAGLLTVMRTGIQACLVFALPLHTASNAHERGMLRSSSTSRVSCYM